MHILYMQNIATKNIPDFGKTKHTVGQQFPETMGKEEGVKPRM